MKEANGRWKQNRNKRRKNLKSIQRQHGEERRKNRKRYAKKETLDKTNEWKKKNEKSIKK